MKYDENPLPLQIEYLQSKKFLYCLLKKFSIKISFGNFSCKLLCLSKFAQSNVFINSHKILSSSNVNSPSDTTL
jgi:hypothetical protein